MFKYKNMFKIELSLKPAGKPPKGDYLAYRTFSLVAVGVLVVQNTFFLCLLQSHRWWGCYSGVFSLICKLYSVTSFPAISIIGI